MGLSNRLVDVAASNTLQAEIIPITRGQAWLRQVRGTYNLIYTYAQADFLHLDDFNDFLQKSYSKHTHGNGNNGSPTSAVLQPATLANTRAQALLRPAGPLGKMRKGISDALRSIQFIDRTNSSDLG